MISKNQIKFIRQLEQKKFRRREGLFVAEGTKVVGDLIAHYQPHSIFATPDWLAEHASHLSPLTSHLYSVTLDELSRISFQQHPQQVLALFPIPNTVPELVEGQEVPLNSSLFTLHSPLLSMAFRTPATSAPSSASPIGLVSRPSTAARTQSMPGIRKLFKPPWAASRA